MIRYFLMNHGYPPSLRQIAEATDLASISSVAYHLSALESKGMLVRDMAVARGLRLTHEGENAAD